MTDQTIPWIDIDGTPVHLVDATEALCAIASASRHENARPLGVVSINLDHVHHFGVSGATAPGAPALADHGQIEWLNLIDGSPIAAQARRVTGRVHPKLSGSDLIGPILADADETGRSVAVLGGSPDVTTSLLRRFAEEWPSIRFAGHWTPAREAISDPAASQALAAEIRAARVDIVLVCLGKPRQEQWIAEFGAETGAGALLAFGAVVDFLAGRVLRAPESISRSGFEWAWRLALEPRRLARRYLVEGPPAYVAVRRSRSRGSEAPIRV